MCAPCKVILNEIDAATATGESFHRAVQRSVAQVLEDLPPEVQDQLSSLDAEHIRQRMAADRDYLDRLLAILGKFAGREF